MHPSPGAVGIRFEYGGLVFGLGQFSQADLDYTPRGDSTYVLIGNVGEQTVVFDSSQQSLQAFAGNLSQKIGGR